MQNRQTGFFRYILRSYWPYFYVIIPFYILYGSGAVTAFISYNYEYCVFLLGLLLTPVFVLIADWKLNSKIVTPLVMFAVRFFSQIVIVATLMYPFFFGSKFISNGHVAMVSAYVWLIILSLVFIIPWTLFVLWRQAK